MTDTVTGRAALFAMAAHLGRSAVGWEIPDLLHGVSRRDYKSHQAFVELVAAIEAAEAETIYEAYLGAVSIDQVTFGQSGSDEGEEDEEVYFSLAARSVEASSVRVRQSPTGVWAIADRWADDIILAFTPDAPFDLVMWETDAWDQD
ncbi:hypothetical protein [Sphingobium sp. R-7]|uniref:hypothetical protein n=1 Tax=Sphingobium sp. R-7 TaxID=3375449 RepID=UPI00398B737E